MEVDNPQWYIDEGLPGAGPRPAWLPEKFKTAADLAKSHNELEKKLGTVPDDYDFTKSKYLDPDYAPFQELKKVAKDKRVPQEVMDKMLESVDKFMDEYSTNPDEEKKKLGDNADDRIATVDNWAKANLSEASYKALTANVRSADAFKAMEELRGKMMSNTPHIPSGNENANSGAASLVEIQKELSNNLDKYKKDPTYQADIQRRLAVAVKGNPEFIDKVGA